MYFVCLEARHVIFPLPLGPPTRRIRRFHLVCKTRGGAVIIICHLVTTGGPGEKGLAALPGREAEFKTILAASIDYAKALNCKMYKNCRHRSVL